VRNVVDDLQHWYVAQCDGDWEHSYGVHIETLDNPGWAVTIHVRGTPLEVAAFEPVQIERTDHDWLHCTVGVPDRANYTGFRARAFLGYCGPHNLAEVLSLFLRWAEEAGTN